MIVVLLAVACLVEVVVMLFVEAADNLREC